MKSKVSKVILFIIMLPIALLGQDLSQKEIIGIKRTTLTTDFNFKEKGDVYPITVLEKSYSEMFGLSMTINYEFNNSKKIVNKVEDYASIYEQCTYSYNAKGQLNNIKVYDRSGDLRALFPETTYEYNDSGNLQYVKSIPQFLRDEQVDAYSYDLANRKVVMSSTTGDEKIFLLNKNFQIIERILTMKGIKYKTNFEYDNLGRVIKIDEFNKFGTSEELTTHRAFSYNAKGDILSRTNVTNQTVVYDYIYDDYGNWIAKFVKGTLRASLNVDIREITYSNGKVTGYKDNTDTTLIAQLKEATKIPNGIVVKLTDKSKGYVIFKDGKNISNDKDTYALFIIDKHLIFQNITDNEIYIVNNYKTKENYVYLPLKVKTVTHGFWYKTDNAGYVIINSKGKNIIANIKESGFDVNQVDYNITLKSGKKITLKNFNATGINDAKSIELYKENSPKATIVTANSSRQYVQSNKFSSCKDLKCLENAFAVTALQCDMEAKCSGEEWAENLSGFISTAEYLNLPFSSWQASLKSNFDTAILYNAWAIYYFLNSDANQKYKTFLLNNLDQKKKDVLTQMGKYLNDGNLNTNLPKGNVGFYSFDTFNNGLEIYRLDLREAELLKQFESQSGIKQGETKSRVDIDKVLSKLIAPENRTVYWQKLADGFEVTRTFGNIKAKVVNTIEIGDHLIGRDLVLGKQYLLRNFKNAQLNVKYEALEYGIDTNFWIKKGNSATLVIDGEANNVAIQDSPESPVDAITTYKGKYYLLGDYENAEEGKVYVCYNISMSDYELSKGEKAPSKGIYWKHYGVFYYLVKDGEYIDFEVEHTFRGNDALVYHPKSNATIIINNYTGLNDGKWRKAVVLKENQAAWIKYENGTFNCYEKATKSITKNKWSTENSNDLWIMNYKGKPKYNLENYKSAAINTFYIAKKYGDKTVYETEVSNSNSSASVSKYQLSETEKSAILKCGEDEECLTIVFDNKYKEMRESLSGNELSEKFADYTMALNAVKPGKLFGIFMKSDYAVSSGIFDILPKEEMDKIKKEAQELMDGYNKHINSKETRDAIKKHGGTIGN